MDSKLRGGFDEGSRRKGRGGDSDGQGVMDKEEICSERESSPSPTPAKHLF
jgi:hypothetical protein